MNRTELLIHPLRLRILQHLSVYKEATTNEIISALPEVSKASVYNHIKLLESNHIIQVWQRIPCSCRKENSIFVEGDFTLLLPDQRDSRKNIRIKQSRKEQ